jgi:hypothetical protein
MRQEYEPRGVAHAITRNERGWFTSSGDPADSRSAREEQIEADLIAEFGGAENLTASA